MLRFPIAGRATVPGDTFRNGQVVEGRSKPCKRPESKQTLARNGEDGPFCKPRAKYRCVPVVEEKSASASVNGLAGNKSGAPRAGQSGAPRAGQSYSSYCKCPSTGPPCMPRARYIPVDKCPPQRQYVHKTVTQPGIALYNKTRLHSGNPDLDLDVTMCPKPVQGTNMRMKRVQGATMRMKPAQDNTMCMKPVQDIIMCMKPTQDITMRMKPVQDITMRMKPVQDIAMRMKPVRDITMRMEPVRDVTMCMEPVQDVAMCMEPVQDVTMCPEPQNFGQTFTHTLKACENKGEQLCPDSYQQEMM